MTLSEKSAYLKGLMEGMKLDTETNEGKLISEIISMLQDVAENVSDLEEVVDCISDELDCIEEDLDNIIRFYETPSGRRMADAQPKIATDAMGVAQQWAMQFAQKMGEIFKSAQASEPSSVPGK